MKKSIKKVKDNITPSQYKLLISSLKGNDNIRENRKERLLRVFVLLYNLGIRVNELSQFTYNKLNDLLDNGKTIITSHKQGSEKYIYITENGKKEIIKIFDSIPYSNDYIFVSERGNKKNTLNPISMIADVNKYLKFVFGANTRISSHSFRQTLISNLATNGVNTKIIQNLIGHKSINTTYRYIKTTETDIMKSLEMVR